LLLFRKDNAPLPPTPFNSFHGEPIILL
jgi:hypothetical protein